MSGRLRPSYPFLLGACVGALVAGLIVPLAIDPADDADGADQGGGAAGTSLGVDGARGAGTGSAASSPGPGGTASVADGADTTAGTGGGAAPTAAGGARPTGVAASADGPDQSEAPAPPRRVGVALLKVGGLEQVGQAIGIPPPAVQREIVEAFIADVNDHGGAGGRPLEAVYATVDAIDQGSERPACLALVDDGEAFAVVGTFVSQAGTLCVTQEHGRPLVNPGLVALDETIAASRGLLFTLHARAGRAVTNLAVHLHEQGALDGRTVGVVTADSVDPKGELAAQTRAVMERLGHPAPAVSRLSADLSVAASQMPVEVRRQQAAGVDFVVLLTPGLLSAQFVQQAERQGYRPHYGASDFGPMSPDSSVQNMPDSFDGAYLVTATNGADANDGVPENADAAGCRAIYEARTPHRFARGSNAAGLSAGMCAGIAVLDAGLDAAGAGATPATFSEGVQRAGRFPLLAPTWGGGSFAPGKHDMADLIRTNRFHADCTCWRAAEPFGPPHA